MPTCSPARALVYGVVSWCQTYLPEDLRVQKEFGASLGFLEVFGTEQRGTGCT